MMEVQGEPSYNSDFVLEDVFLGDENIVPGSETKIWAIVKNMGNGQPEDSQIAFYVNDVIFDEKSIKSKPKGYSVTAISNSWEYPGGIVSIKACADPNDTTFEKNEDNNCNSIQFPTKQEITTKPGSKMIVPNLSIAVTPSIIQEGVETLVTVKGNLTDRISGIGISGKSILIGHPENSVKVVTDSKGFYSHTFSVTVKSDSWRVSASFSGDTMVRGSNALSAIVVVDYPPPPIEESPLELPILPDDGVTTPVEPTPLDDDVKVPELSIPNWIKDTAALWSDRSVDDSDFAGGISYLIEEEIISIPNLPDATEVLEEKVPEWVRNMAGWWADDLTSDQEFADAIKFLVERGIVQIQT